MLKFTLLFISERPIWYVHMLVTFDVEMLALSKSKALFHPQNSQTMTPMIVELNSFPTIKSLRLFCEPPWRCQLERSASTLKVPGSTSVKSGLVFEVKYSQFSSCLESEGVEFKPRS